MSSQWTHCKDCHYEKTHTETQHPCSHCYEGDEGLDPRVPILEAQVAKLESENADLKAKLKRDSDTVLKALQHKGAADRRTHRIETECKARLEEAMQGTSKAVVPLRKRVSELESMMARVCDIAWEYQDA